MDYGTLCAGGCQSRVEDFGLWLAGELEREQAPRLRELAQEVSALIDAGEPGAAYAKLIENRRISDDLFSYKARAPLSLPSAEHWAVEPFRDHEDVRRFHAPLARTWAGKRRGESVLEPLFRWWWRTFPPKS
jgi:hypothetical protein